MDALFSLEGRTALVTGGSRGIGRMIAQGFLERGARVYIASRKADACAAAAAELSAFGTCVALAYDISTIEGEQTLAADFANREPGLHVLVNNAGAAWLAPFDTYPEKGWDKVVDLNLKAPFFLTQALIGSLRAGATAARPAKVINVASTDGLRLNPQESYAYQASKAGLIHLTRRMAATLIADHICVSAIAPGAFASDMNVAARDQPDALSAVIPAARIGRTEDIQGAAIFLASRAGDYVVGATLAVDGGVGFATL